LETTCNAWQARWDDYGFRWHGVTCDPAFLLTPGCKPSRLPARGRHRKCWLVEHTFAWLARHRRHSKTYEKTAAASEALTSRIIASPESSMGVE
jgi:transposase